MRLLPSVGSTESAAPNAPRMARQRERGAGRMKAILWTLVLAAFVYVPAQVLPALISGFGFPDGVQTIARFATATRQTPEQIRAAILKEAQKDNVPLEGGGGKVEAVRGNGRL